MILRRLADAISQQNWFTVVLEILIVVVGIFIGLQVDDWNQTRQDKAIERVYLQELLEDYEADKAALEDSTKRFVEILAAMSALLEQSALETSDWPIDQLNKTFSNIHRMPAFINVDRTFANLTGSGDLRLIRNRNIKNAMAQYLSASDLVELIQSTHEMELVQTFQPYVIENLDFQAVHYKRINEFPLPPPVEADRILEVLHSRAFRNILTQKWTIIDDLLNQHRKMQTRADAVIKMITDELNRSAGGES